MSAPLAPTDRDRAPREGPRTDAGPQQRSARSRKPPAEPDRARFSDVLRRIAPRRDPSTPRREPAAPPPVAGPAAVPAAGPPPAEVPPPAGSGPVAATETPAAVPLADVEAAWSADGAALSFTVQDGSLAGLRMAFLLRGDTLEVGFDASATDVVDRVAAREDAVREALAERGIDLGRYDADERHSRRDDGGDDALPSRPAPVRRAAAALPGATSGRDYLR